MRLSILAIAAAMIAVGSGVATAHHSYAEFQDQPATIQGTLVQIEFKNPHTLLKVRGMDGNEYMAIWNAAFQLRTQGVHDTDLKAGDVVSLTGFPSRDAAVHQMAKLRTVRRTSDGWTWQVTNGRASVGKS